MTLYILVEVYNAEAGTTVDFAERHEIGSLFKQRQKTGTFVTCLKEPVEKHVIIVHNIPISFLKELDENEFELLKAIPLPEINRFTVFMDRHWLREGLTLSPGAPVNICNHRHISTGAEGVIRYKGNLPGKHGVWFGIELAPQHAGEGTTDGSFRHEKFFTCSEDCGIFVSIFRIRKDEHYVRNRNISPELRDHEAGLSSIDLETFPFRLGERVVWVSDEGPENGTIKWIGRLPESNDGAIVVGVYFDRPVGSGTGRYKGRQLFDTPRGHASLMPPLGLMKYSDFYVDSGNGSGARSLSDGPSGERNFTSLETSPPSWSRHNDPDIVQSSIGHTLRARAVESQEFLPRGGFTGSSLTSDYISELPARSAATGSTTRSDNPYESHYPHSSPPPSGYGTENYSQNIPTLPFRFEVGSRVYALVRHKRYGVIRYIGDHPKNPERQIAGIEMEIPDTALYTDGTFSGVRYFVCPPNRAFFNYLDKCQPDDRGYY